MPPPSDPAVPTVPTVTPVTISYSELQDKDKDLSVKIEEGFGPNGLGILSITHTLKGSFYANPILDSPTTDESLIQRYPSYCGSNIWPNSELPELEVAFKALGKVILGVGLMVAYHCDRYGMVFLVKVYTKRA
ncbi:hypothetical protein ACFX1R_027961 [Malus domestica]